MIIKDSITRDNQAPKNKIEKDWLKKHEEERKMAIENNCCPSCFRKVDEIYDHGYKYGFDCWLCT